MVTARAWPHMGGIETHVDEVSRRIAELGATVTVLTSMEGEDDAPKEQRGPVQYIRFVALPRSRDYYLSPALLRHLRRGRYDVVHVQGAHTVLAPTALAAARAAGMRTVLTFHTGGSSSRLRGAARTIQWTLDAPVFRRADRLIAVCEFEADLFARRLRLPRREITVIRNGAERLHASIPDHEQEVDGSPLILSIGRLERYKGHHRVIAAMPYVLRERPAAHLTIVGSGPYHADLERQVTDLALSQHVSFATYPPRHRDDLGALIASSNVVTLLSEYEAHPVSVMEALAEGVNVVVADTSGLSELGRQGLVATVGIRARPEHVAFALIRAADRHRRTEPYPLNTWDDCAGEILDQYRKATASS
jgi:glycosyltransferase involved in cell wall biosynthesis